jgi:ribosomal protein S27E
LHFPSPSPESHVRVLGDEPVIITRPRVVSLQECFNHQSCFATTSSRAVGSIAILLAFVRIAFRVDCMRCGSRRLVFMRSATFSSQREFLENNVVGRRHRIQRSLSQLRSNHVFLFLILGDRLTLVGGDRSFSTRVPARPPFDRLDMETLCGLFVPAPHAGSSGKGIELG